MDALHIPCGEQLLFDFAREGIEEAAQDLVTDYVHEARKRAKRLNWVIRPLLFPTGRRILGCDRHLQAAVLLSSLCRVLPGVHQEMPRSGDLPTLLRGLVSRIARRRLPITRDQAAELVALLAEHAACFTYAIPVLGVLRVVYRHVRAHGLTASLESNVRNLRSVWRYDWYFNSHHKIQGRIARILATGRRAPARPCRPEPHRGVRAI